MAEIQEKNIEAISSTYFRMFVQMFRGTSAVDTFCTYPQPHFWQQEMRMVFTGLFLWYGETSCHLSTFGVQNKYLYSSILWYDSDIQLALTGKQTGLPGGHICQRLMQLFPTVTWP